MFVTTLVGALTEDDASPRYQLGSLHYHYDEIYGPQVYRYVRNNSGSTIGANLGVMQENGANLYQVTLSGANCESVRFLGVTVASIANTYCGWVVADGFCRGTSDGSTTANTAQQCAAGGKFTDGVVGSDELVAWACETETPAGDGGTMTVRVAAL